MFKVKNKEIKTTSMSSMYGVFIFSLHNIPHLSLVFLSVTLSKFTGIQQHNIKIVQFEPKSKLETSKKERGGEECIYFEGKNYLKPTEDLLRFKQCFYAYKSHLY